MGKINLSVIAIFHNMRREASRTLRTLAQPYQLDVDTSEYEVIVVDNGSTEPLNPDWVHSFGRNFLYKRYDNNPTSPCWAINQAVRESSGDIVMICIDGARMLSPKILSLAKKALSINHNSFVYTLSLHLGPKLQSQSMLDGYNQAVEDEMLSHVNWTSRGYLLFNVASLGGSCLGGYYSPINESNCLSLRKNKYLEMGGYDENFLMGGGGLANLDFFERLHNENDLQPILLLGEATFHQFHGGIASNATFSTHPWKKMAAEYKLLRNKDYAPIFRAPLYLGFMEEEAKFFIAKHSSV